MTTNRATPIRKTSLPLRPHRPSPARTTGPVPGLEKGIIMCPIPRTPRQPGRRGSAGQFIHDITAAASVATGQHRPAPTATPPQRRTMIPPRTIQLRIHHRQRPAGFRVSRTTGQTARRPWRLSWCQGLDQSRYHTIPFDGYAGAGR